jgi:hypothetical protein
MKISPCSSRNQLSCAQSRDSRGESRLTRHPFTLVGKALVVTDLPVIKAESQDSARCLQRSRGPLGKCSSCDVLPANLKVKVGGDDMETESHWCGGKRRRRARVGRRAAEAACETACGDVRRRRRAKLYGMPCGFATKPLSIAAAEKGQAVWPGTGARLFVTLSAGGRGGGGEPSGATSVRRGQGEAKRRSRLSRGETDTGGAEHTRGKLACLNTSAA